MTTRPQRPSADELVTMYKQVQLGMREEDSATAQRSPEHLAAWRRLKGEASEALVRSVTTFDIPDWVID